MAQIIDARVKQKTGTAADFAGYQLLSGEIALVRTSANGPVWNFKVGPGNFDSLYWSLQNPGAAQKADTSTVFPTGVPGLYVPTEDGTYEGVTVDLSAGYTQLIWDGATLTDVVFPIDLSGYATIDKGIDGSSAGGTGLNLLTDSGVFKITGANNYMMYVANVGGVTRQYRVEPNMEGRPRLTYRDNVGGTWSNWRALPSFDGYIPNFAGLDNQRNPGNYLMDGANPYQVYVAETGGVVRQIRTLANFGASPQIIFRDYIDGVWSAWTTAPSFTKGLSSADVNTTTTSGVYMVEVTNPYVLYIVNVGGVTRQYRLDPNMAGVPRIVFRDNDGSGWTGWTPADSGGTSQVAAREASQEDAIWSWWIYPAIQRISSPVDKFAISYADSHGNTGVITKSLANETLVKVPLKPERPNIDDHNAGSIAQLPDGRFLTAFSSGHNGARYYVYRSQRPYDTSNWEKVLDVAHGSLKDYSQMLVDGSNVRIFYRARISPRWEWHVITSTDSGGTWSTPSVVLTSNPAQWYALFRPVAGDADLIRIAHYSNPTAGLTDIRGGFLRISTGQLLDANGTTVLGTLGGAGVDVGDFTVVVPKPPGKNNRLLDMAVTADWQILYCTFSDNTDGDYIHHDNGTTRPIVAAGRAFYTSSRYVGGAVFGDGGVIYASRQVGNTGEWLVESYELSSGNYVVTEEHDRTQGVVAVRPVYHNGVLAWQRGRYNTSSFTDFYTELVYKDFA